MNEEELKQIWRKKEAIPLKSINMEFIQQYTVNTQNSLQKLARREMIAGLIALVIFALDFIYTGNFYFGLSWMAIICIYFLWDKRRKAKADEINRTENVRKYLLDKEKELKRDAILTRTFIFLGSAAFALNLKWIEESRLLDESFRNSHPDYSITSYIVFLIVIVSIIQLCCEVYVRTNYYPILEDLRYLIEELDGDKDNNMK